MLYLSRYSNNNNWPSRTNFGHIGRDMRKQLLLLDESYLFLPLPAITKPPCRHYTAEKIAIECSGGVPTYKASHKAIHLIGTCLVLPSFTLFSLCWLHANYQFWLRDSYKLGLWLHTRRTRLPSGMEQRVQTVMMMMRLTK